jgi:hypothetical protein
VEPAGVDQEVTVTPRSNASSTFCPNGQGLVRGEVVRLSVPDAIPGHMFFDWRRRGSVLAWTDTYVEDGEDFAFADTYDDGVLSPLESMVFGWRRPTSAPLGYPGNLP